MTTRTDALARPLPPWPGVLPLAEAAALLGLKADTLQKRVSRRQQPSRLRGGRRQVMLLPHQWATWALSYQPARTDRPRAESAPPRTDRAEAELLHRLEALERRVAELEARPASPSLTDQDSPPALPSEPVPWWRRLVAWLGTPPAPAARRAPLPQSE